MLLRRGYARSRAAIEQKVHDIVNYVPSLRSPEFCWDVNAVDKWIDNFLQGPEFVNRLIDIKSEDAELVAQSQSIDRLLRILRPL
ncbi:hypothetical protein NYO67_2136 [Aspergillus flavus]|nr:hypothetical protein NYO67_2136 [Aspergillus flavus]